MWVFITVYYRIANCGTLVCCNPYFCNVVCEVFVLRTTFPCRYVETLTSIHVRVIQGAGTWWVCLVHHLVCRVRLIYVCVCSNIVVCDIPLFDIAVCVTVIAGCYY